MRKLVMDEIGRIERRIGLHDLRVLMAVVKAGSMGKAAKLLATSQSAVSRSIGELEQTLLASGFSTGAPMESSRHPTARHW
jgi:DNA-binding MarR family transcriptional regulator